MVFFGPSCKNVKMMLQTTGTWILAFQLCYTENVFQFIFSII